MPWTASFVPDRLNIAKDDVKELVLLQFGQADNNVELVFPQSTIRPLFEEIMKAGRFEPLAPIEPADFSNAITFVGHDVGRTTDGQVILNIQIRTDDGVRALALKMLLKDALDLAALLTKHASE